MEEINLQKKERGPAWLWIVGVLAIAGIIWAIAGRTDEAVVESGESAGSDTATIVMNEARSVDIPQSIDAFLSFSSDSSRQGVMGLDHDYTAAGIGHLGAALGDLSKRFDSTEMDIRTRRDTMMQRASRLHINRLSDTHADIVRTIFISAADLMNSIQERHFPSLDNQVRQVEAAAAAIAPDRKLLDQQDAVKRFFQQASATLDEMARQPVG